MKPTIDTNRPKHWSPGGACKILFTIIYLSLSLPGGRRRRPMSANVNNVKTQSLRNSRQFPSNDHLTNREFWSSNDCIDGVGYDYGYVMCPSLFNLMKLKTNIVIIINHICRPPAQFQLNNSTLSKGLVKVQIMGSQGSLSDKIDNFFEEVNQQVHYTYKA